MKKVAFSPVHKRSFERSKRGDIRLVQTEYLRIGGNMAAADNFPESFFKPEKSESLSKSTTLTAPYSPDNGLDSKIDKGEIGKTELDPSSSPGAWKIPPGEVIRRDLYYRCQFAKPAPDETPLYDEGDGCFIWRLLYDCYLVEDLVWVRRFGRKPILLAQKTQRIFVIYKYVRVCEGRGVTVLDKWEKGIGEYDPGKDAHAGERSIDEPGMVDPEKTNEPSDQNGAAPPPGSDVSPDGLIETPDLPKGWVTEPRPSTPPPNPPPAHPAPPFITPPPHGEITSADAGKDSSGNVIEKRRYWKLRMVRLGADRCVEYATYDYWEDTYLHNEQGGSTRAKSEPFQPQRSETVPIRIPGCE
jgi:hypothetical protein